MARKELTFCWKSLLFSATQQQQRQQRQAAMEKLAASPAKMQNVVPAVSAGEEADVGVEEDADVVRQLVCRVVAALGLCGTVTDRCVVCQPSQQQQRQQRQAAMEKLAASPAKMQNVVPSVSAGEEADVGVEEDEDVVQDAVVELVAVMAVARQLVRLMILLVSDAFSDGGSFDMNLSLL
jgi:hypothetical protein